MEAKRTGNFGLGIASFVLGCMCIFFGWIPLLGAPLPVLGLILGLIQTNWKQHGLSIAGIVINGLFCGIQVMWIACMIIGSFVE